jgi:hypothetical protein
VSCEIEIVFALGDTLGFPAVRFPAVDLLGTIFFGVEGEVAEAVDRIDASEGEFCA